MSKIAIINQHTNNYGDDAAGVALVREVLDTLEADHVDIFYIWHKSGQGLPIHDERCQHHLLDDLSGKSDMRAKLALSLIAGRLFRKAPRSDIARLVATCREADVVFVSPAGSNIGIYKDWTYLLVLVALVMAGVRPTFCQNTIGKSNSRIFDRIALFVLRRSHLFVREEASQRWLASQSLSSYLGVDTALLLQALPVPDAGDPTENRPYVALVPTQLSNWHRDFRGFDDGAFLHEILPRAVARVAVGMEVDVVVVPHLYGPENEGEFLAEVVKKLVGLGARAEIARVDTFEDYWTQLVGATSVVSMRYHGLILSAQGTTPCVAISYENKMLEAATYLGTPGLALRVQDASEQLIAEMLLDSIDRGGHYRQVLASRRDEVRLAALGPILNSRSMQLRKPSRGPLA